MSRTGTLVWDRWPREEPRARGERFGQKAVPKYKTGAK